MGEGGRKVLFVDDEPGIRMTLPQILQMHGYKVTTTASVAEALAAMQTDRFDVLISDLNIGQPGDGFTVVSAMRRTQPHAVTLILTGYPAFETALEAIRCQVDDYLVKPTAIEHLVGTIERNLSQHTPTTQIVPQKLSVFLRKNKAAIAERWLKELQAEDVFGSSRLTPEEIVENIPAWIDELITMLDMYPGQVSVSGLEIAAEHGRKRRKQGVSIATLIGEIRLLRQAIYRLIQENLLSIHTSYVIGDMIAISDSLDRQARASLEGYSEMQGVIEKREVG